MRLPILIGRVNKLLSHIAAAIVITAALSIPTLAQAQTPGGTVISNQASATYSDGTNSFSTVSNTVTVTVSNVSGIVITPDAGSRPSVVAGQTGVLYSFRVTNTGNFSDQVRFLASGASATISGPGSITRAVIDVNSSGTITGTDTDIKTNGADVLSAVIAQNGFIDVLVEVSVSAAATSSQVIQVVLGDGANQAADSSANEVRTVSSSSVNGLREDRGDISATVDNDAQLRVTLVAPSGPVALGSNISYTMQTCNPGARPAASISLPGGFSGVYIIAPIPAGTALATGQSFPPGTLYTTTALTTAPTAATWSITAPATLSDTTRVAFNVGNSLAVGACSANITMQVTITTSDASNPIYEIVDTFGANSIGTTLTDQSGDNSSNQGDGNANFDEPRDAQPADPTKGFQQKTTLQQLGAVLLGPQGQPAATGPTSQDDDYTNRSVTTGIAGVAPGGVTTASGTVTFTNTIKNTGNAADIYQLSMVSTEPGFTVEASVDGGIFTPLVGSGAYISVPVAFGASQNVFIRITAPAGKTVLTGYNTLLRATSTIPLTASSNDTIDRLYTGFIRLLKTVTVNNTTGVGGATDPVPGAQLIYAITYDNISSSGGDANNVRLTATNIVITEDGNAAPPSPNNWGTTTNHVVGATDTLGGTITGDTAGSTVLTDSVASLAPSQSGVFTFKRQIK
jgi:hypothetical protein